MTTATTLPAGFIQAMSNSQSIKIQWLALPSVAGHKTPKKAHPTLPRGVEAVPNYQTARLWVAKHNNIQITKDFRCIPSKYSIKQTLYSQLTKIKIKPQKSNMISLKKRESIFGIILDKAGCSNRWIKKIT
jgi:hypothetical protein